MTTYSDRYAKMSPGDPAPGFQQRAFGQPRFDLSSLGGRYLVLCFFASAALEGAQAALSAVFRRPDIFDGLTASFIGVSIDPDDEAQDRIRDRYPGYNFVWDFDGRASRLFGAIPHEAVLGRGRVNAQPSWVVIDPTLRVLKVAHFLPDGSDIQELIAYLEQLPPPALFAGIELQAPIVLLPNVFEPDLCDRLIELYRKVGGEESGVMQDIGGKTVGVLDARYKRRRDCTIEDSELLAAIRSRFTRRVVPEIAKVHQFAVTRMERYIVCCYAAEDGGHFGAHRDNTTKGTAHRRFAASINLNEDFEGGEVGFPEYGPRTFKPPRGGAVVFSCSLLHSVSRVTRGERFAFLPFLYDDAAASIREANLSFVAQAQLPKIELSRTSSGLLPVHGHPVVMRPEMVHETS